MPRALSWVVIAASFLGGVFLPDLVAKAAVPERKPVSSVAVDDGPGGGALETPGLAPGAAMREGAHGGFVPEEADKITPLDVRDAAALVFAPGAAAPPPCAQKPCDCAQDSLHRYEPKKRRKAEFESLRGKKAAPGPAPGD
jgi:hypothetical protein